MIRNTQTITKMYTNKPVKCAQSGRMLHLEFCMRIATTRARTSTKGNISIFDDLAWVGIKEFTFWQLGQEYNSLSISTE